MKNFRTLLIYMTLACLTSMASFAGYWCVANTNCGFAEAYVPTGGSCTSYESDCYGRVITYDANGNIYDMDGIRCVNC